jgi:uncharacterized delta-60 repeat protein
VICRAALAACATLALAAGAALGAPADRGHHRLQLGNRSAIADMATDPSGRLVVVWTTMQCDPITTSRPCANPRLLVSRLRPNGKADRKFHHDGGVVIPNGEVAGEIAGIAVQPDGRILVATSRFIVRLGPRGRLDQSFGDGGFVPTDQRVSSYAPYRLRLALAPDGSFALIGTAYVSGLQFAAARYRADGTPVTSFGTAGVARGSLAGGWTTSGVIDADGRIVIGGAAATGRFEQSFVAARLLTDGSLDPAFGGGDGITTIAPYPDYSFSLSSVVSRIFVLPGGQIALVGHQNANRSATEVAIGRWSRASSPTDRSTPASGRTA